MKPITIETISDDYIPYTYVGTVYIPYHKMIELFENPVSSERVLSWKFKIGHSRYHIYDWHADPNTAHLWLRDEWRLDISRPNTKVRQLSGSFQTLNTFLKENGIDTSRNKTWYTPDNGSDRIRRIGG